MNQEPINQPSFSLTRKLTAATIAGALVSISGLIVRNIVPDWYDAEVWAAMTRIAIFAVGYFVKDLPNG